MLHLLLHFLTPALVSGIFFRKRKYFSYLVMMATMLVDMDHLLATPIYDSARCSIGFHPLHQPWFIAIYIVLCFYPKSRLVGAGLVIHMVLDQMDCF
jgi:hypothetical protein